jgi:hypothetical protein
MSPLSHLKKFLALKKKKKLRAKAEARRRASRDGTAAGAAEVHSERLPTGLTLEHEIINTENNRKRQTLLLMSAAIEVLSLVKEASEATSILAPLKALCVTLSKLLELAEVGGRTSSHGKVLKDLLFRQKSSTTWRSGPFSTA